MPSGSGENFHAKGGEIDETASFTDGDKYEGVLTPEEERILDEKFKERAELSKKLEEYKKEEERLEKEKKEILEKIKARAKKSRGFKRFVCAAMMALLATGFASSHFSKNVDDANSTAASSSEAAGDLQEYENDSLSAEQEAMFGGVEFAEDDASGNINAITDGEAKENLRNPVFKERGEKTLSAEQEAMFGGVEFADEATTIAGEEGESIDVTYDYSHWKDFENKSSHNAFDYDYSDRHGNTEKTKEGIMEVANRTPEALASYAYTMLNDAEKAELGIAGMTATEIDDYMSDKNNPDAGRMQERLLDALGGILNADNTTFEFYNENDVEWSYYIHFMSDADDGNYTPDEMHLGQARVKRNNAPQVDVKRDGIKVADLNEYCGYQLNRPDGNPFEGVFIVEDSSVVYVPPVAPPSEVGGPEEEKQSEPVPEEEKQSEPVPEEETPSETPPDDSKNAAAIKKNMQTGGETTNRVVQKEAGELSALPDNSENSFEQEQQHQEQVVEEARSEQSESENGGTVGEIIEASDQSLAEHENYTPEQIVEQQQQEQGQATDAAATETAEKVDEQAATFESLTDEAAAEWYNDLINSNGGQQS